MRVARPLWRCPYRGVGKIFDPVDANSGSSPAEPPLRPRSGGQTLVASAQQRTRVVPDATIRFAPNGLVLVPMPRPRAAATLALLVKAPTHATSVRRRCDGVSPPLGGPRVPVFVRG